MKKVNSRLDRIGITASTLCAIHCAVTPFVITILPLIGLGILANPWFEWGMILIAVTIGAFTIAKSYFLAHGHLLPVILLSSGLAMVILGRLFTSGWLEVLIVPLGGITIAIAHFLNIRYLKICKP